MNQSNNGEINIEVPEVNYPVTSVDKKANTFGISVSPTTGDVKIENTGLTGIHIQQSGQNRYAQITGGTDATHDDVEVKTKDVTLTLPIPQSIEAVAVDEENKIDAIAVELEDKGDVEHMTAEEKVSLSLDKSKANAHLYLKRSEDSESEDLGKIFAENDITIDLTGQGKLIRDTEVTASSDPGGMNTIRFNYTDGTYDEFKVMNGLDGHDGSPGSKGDTPEITSEVDGDYTYVYADGSLIATLKNGHSPVVDAQRTGPKQTTIYVDGVPKAVINDGADGQSGGDETDEMEVVSGISFEFSSDGKTLNAKVTKKKIKAVFVEDIEPVDVKVCDADNIDVVVKSTYNADGDYKFKNIRKRMTVLGNPTDAQGQDVFTTTPLSGE